MTPASIVRPDRTPARLSSLPAVVFCLAAVVLPQGATAQEGAKVSGKELARLGFFQDFDELSLDDLLAPDEETVSVASRREQPLSETPGVVTVVDHEQIQSLGARTLRDVLLTLPGFDIVTDNLGRGRIVLRGFRGFGGSSESVLLLMDGHRLNEGINGGATLINLDLPVEKIKRIEVLRGPGSALYGDAALAGVIDIITHSPGELSGITVEAAGGSFAARQIALSLGSPLGGLQIAGFVHFDDLDGARSLVPEDAQTRLDRANPALAPLSLAPDLTTDDRRTLESYYRVTYGGFSLDWRLMQETSKGFVGPTDALGVHNDLNSKQMGLHMGYSWSVGEGGSLAARLGWTQNQVRELLEVFPAGQGAFTSGGTPATLDSGGLLQTALNSRRLAAELVLQRGLPGGHEIVAGLSIGREATWGLEANANVDFRDLTLLRDPVAAEGVQEVEVEMDPLEGVVEDAERTAVGLFVQDSWRIFSPDVAFTAGVRLDHHSDVGTVASPRLAAVWTLPRSFTLKTLYGRAFRAPSFRELHFYLPGLIGNPDLETTVTDTFDASLRYGGETVDLSLGLFLSRVRDPILPEAPYSVASPQQLVNVPGFDTRGVEVEAQANLGAHVAFGSFTALRAEHTETGERSPDVPSYQATLGATFLLGGRFSFTPTVMLRSSRPRAVGDERNELPGYGLLGLSFHGREVFRDLDVGVTIRNLLDEEYFDPSPLLGVPGDYPRPGRSLLVHAEYRF